MYDRKVKIKNAKVKVVVLHFLPTGRQVRFKF